MQIKLPPLGEGANSGTVSGIFVKKGDKISKNQPLLELESEKAVASIPSPASGLIEEILVKEGDEIVVGQAIVDMSPSESEVESREHVPAAKRAISVAPTGELIHEQVIPLPGKDLSGLAGLPPPAAPSVRKVARELGIDLRNVAGSQRGGRIVLEDLKAYIARLQQGTIVAREPAAQAVPVESRQETPDFSRWGEVTRKKMTPLRLAISRKMTESWRSIPHVTQFDEADISDVLKLRKIYSPFYEKKGAHLTLTPFLMKALVDALRAHPEFNGSLDSSRGEFVYKSYYHFGIAVDTEQGLLVPVIRDVDKKDLLQLSHELGDLAERARQRKVAIEEMQGGTFTISNQGGIGGRHFTPIINPPEVAILGTGRGIEKSVIRRQRTEKRTMLPLALSYDHRAIDGAGAARFITDLVQRLQEFKESEVRLKS